MNYVGNVSANNSLHTVRFLAENSLGNVQDVQLLLEHTVELEEAGDGIYC